MLHEIKVKKEAEKSFTFKSQKLQSRKMFKYLNASVIVDNGRRSISDHGCQHFIVITLFQSFSVGTGKNVTVI